MANYFIYISENCVGEEVPVEFEFTAVDGGHLFSENSEEPRESVDFENVSDPEVNPDERETAEYPPDFDVSS